MNSDNNNNNNNTHSLLPIVATIGFRIIWYVWGIIGLFFVACFLTRCLCNYSLLFATVNVLDRRRGNHRNRFLAAAQDETASSMMRENVSVSPFDLQIDHRQLAELEETLTKSNGSGRSIRFHLVILIHGLWGNPHELEYLQTKLRHEATRMMTLRSNQASEEEDGKKSSLTEPREILLTHSVTCNHGNTMDGIAAGGKRVAHEVNELIHQIAQMIQKANQQQQQQQTSLSNVNNHTVTLSFVGHSLGGLYARYALKYIDAIQATQPKTTNPVVVTPKVFCTTVTPHLGIAGHTHVPLPRTVEWMVSHVLLQTGRDLFRTRGNHEEEDVIQQMATQPEFLRPLQAFHKRVLYANAFGTDFQVPTSTAAFLADCDSLHYVAASMDPDEGHPRACPGAAVASEDNTCRNRIHSEEETSIEYDESILAQDKLQKWVFKTHRVDPLNLPRSDEEVAEFQEDVALARRLDALGWTKVLYDLRPLLWSISNPFATKSSSLENSLSQPFSLGSLSTDDQTTSLTSSQLLKALTLSKNGNSSNHNERWYAPLAHTILVANAKNPQFAKFSAPGRPIMDELAREMVADIIVTKQ